MQTRRDFCQTVSLLALTAALPHRAFGRTSWLEDPKLTFAKKSLPGGGFMLGGLNDGGNVLVMPSETGPIMVDAKFAHTATALQTDIKALFKAGPALLINTHHHGDHSGGNWAFSETAKIIAHKNFNPRIAANLERDVKGAEARVEELSRSDAAQAVIKEADDWLAKVKTLKAENFHAKQELPDGVSIIESGGVTMQLFHTGDGHTDNDLIIFLPDKNILHMGDLVFNNLHPYIDRGAKANTEKWQDVLRRAIRLADTETVVIPGHGEVTNKTALAHQIEYFDILRNIVMKAIKEGKSKETIAAMKPDEFKNRGFEQLQAMALTAMYEELSEEMH